MLKLKNSKKRRRVEEDDDEEVEVPPQPARHARLNSAPSARAEKKVVWANDDDDEPDVVDEDKDEEDEETELGARGGDSGEDDDDDDENPDDDDDDDDQLKRLEEELAQVPFEVIQEMRKDGRRSTAAAAARSRSALALSSASKSQKATQPLPPRTGKNQPIEMSSKRPVSRFRVVVPGSKREGRDPRFDPLCGSFNEGLFKSAYGFLDEFRDRELQELRTSVAKEKNRERRKELQQKLFVEEQKRKQEQREETAKKQKREWRRTELARVQHGKKPFYLKKAEERKTALVAQYKELKDKNLLDKFMAKRRKKVAAKDHRFIPHQRRATSNS